MNLFETTSNILPIAIVAVLVLHVIFFLLGKKFHVLFLLVGILGMVTNISTSPRFEFFMLAKYLRIYLNVIIIVLGCWLYRKHFPGSATLFLLFSALLYWVSGAWSLTDPIYYLAYNSFFFISVLSGVCLANSVNSTEQLHAGLRVLATIGMIAGAFYLTMYVVNPRMVTLQGRLASLGGCATTFSADCACFAVPSIYLVFYDTKKSLKLFWCIGIALLVACILLSGSRTGAALVLGGLLVFVYQKRRNPIIVGVTLAFIVGILSIALLSLENIDILERYITVGNTRSNTWAETLRVVKTSPLLGFGSSIINGPDGVIELNPHNCFIKMMHNCGIVGVSFLLIAFMLLCIKLCKMIRLAKYNPEQKPLIVFVVAMTFVILLHTLPDHSIVASTSISSVWIGFVFAMNDRLSRLPMLQPQAKRMLVRRVVRQPVSSC